MRLEGNLNLGAAAPLHAELARARGTAITIDASGVEALGGLCLQILIAAAGAWRRDGNEFSIVNPSQAFAEAVHGMGAGQHLPVREPA